MPMIGIRGLVIGIVLGEFLDPSSRRRQEVHLPTALVIHDGVFRTVIAVRHTMNELREGNPRGW
jgi:small basic protein